jgi:predicted acetyltransferase
MGIVIRGIGAAEADEFMRTCFNGFGAHATEEQVADELMLAEVDRLLVADDGGRMVGTAGAFSFGMTVPGGASVPVAGVTAVAVLPTHRRRGVLRQMMGFQLDDVAARGEAIAVLTASEAQIYGRFGYGQATRIVNVHIETRGGLPLRAEPRAGGSLRLVTDPAAHASTVADAYEATRRTRPGEISRTQAWWDHLQLDREKWRDDASARFCVVHEDDDGVVDGYCWYRVKGNETAPSGSRNEVKVWDLAATDPEVEAALLVYLSEIDLSTSITGWCRPVDDPWPLRIVDSRRYRLQRVTDHLYVRVLDVPTALATRTYEAAGSIVLAVDDRFRPSAGGRFRLDVAEDGSATCERVGDGTRGQADLRLDAAGLGSLFLGDVTPSVLAAAGRLAAASPEALRLADRIFPTARAPFCTMEF